MLVTNYHQYLLLKPKDSKEFIQNPTLTKETKLRKHKSSITEYKKLYVITYLILKQSCSNFFKYRNYSKVSNSKKSI